MIVSLIELTPSPGKRIEILELLRFTADHLSIKPGCLSCGVYEKTDREETILYVERWRTEEDVRRHIESNLYRAVLNALDLAMDQRQVTFYEVSDTKSMEFIEGVRSPNKA
jgi:quinol monooxygenase YgiN